MQAPIVLFVYNRPWHTEQALRALSQNKEAAASVLYIYADGPKENASKADLQKIAETRDLLFKEQWCKEVKVVAAEKNKGLANSVIDATTEIVNRYGVVITLEDDVVVGRHFLGYMNHALEMYKEHCNVYMVSGYIFPIREFGQSQSSFLLPFSTAQAWGTWKRAWSCFDPVAAGYEALKTSNRLRNKFNLDNTCDYSGMLIKQMESDSISSWAIRFWWSIFKINGLVLFPDKSMIKNIGWDGSGVHSGIQNPYDDQYWDSEYKIIYFPKNVVADSQRFNQLKVYLQLKQGIEKEKYSRKFIIFLQRVKTRVF